MNVHESGLSPDMLPDATANVRDLFDGVDHDFEVPAFKERTEYVPEIDEAYRFDPETTMAFAVASGNMSGDRPDS